MTRTRMNQSESWPKQSKDLKYHFKYQIPIPLKFNQKKGQYRRYKRVTGKSSAHWSLQSGRGYVYLYAGALCD